MIAGEPCLNMRRVRWEELTFSAYKKLVKEHAALMQFARAVKEAMKQQQPRGGLDIDGIYKALDALIEAGVKIDA